MAGHADGASQALRSGSTEDLVSALRVALFEHHGFRDYRDVLLDFAPFFDAARRLGADPAEVFDRAAEGLPTTSRISPAGSVGGPM
jgi:hypothetical protein